MNEKFKSSFTWVAIAYVVLGLILLIWPATTMLVICRLIGALMLAYGGMQLVRFIRNKLQMTTYAEVGAGVISAVMGLLLLLRPQLFIAILPMLVGIMILVDSLMRLQTVFALRQAGYPRWWVQLILVVLTLFLGLLLIVNPFEGMTVAVTVMGAFLLVNGLIDLFDIFFMSRRI